jgi:predicted nucleotidyltransferase
MASADDWARLVRFFAEKTSELQPSPTSVAIFGSGASQSWHADSDLDLLVLSKDLPSKPFERTQWIAPLLKTWRAERSQSFSMFPRTLSPLLLKPADFTQSLGLRLSTSQKNIIILDDSFLMHSLEEARSWINTGAWTRKDLRHGGWLWVPKGDVA